MAVRGRGSARSSLPPPSPSPNPFTTETPTPGCCFLLLGLWGAPDACAGRWRCPLGLLLGASSCSWQTPLYFSFYLYFFFPFSPIPLQSSLFIAARTKGRVPCWWISLYTLTTTEICGFLFLAGKRLCLANLVINLSKVFVVVAAAVLWVMWGEHEGKRGPEEMLVL